MKGVVLDERFCDPAFGGLEAAGDFDGDGASDRVLYARKSGQEHYSMIAVLSTNPGIPVVVQERAVFVSGGLSSESISVAHGPVAVRETAAAQNPITVQAPHDVFTVIYCSKGSEAFIWDSAKKAFDKLQTSD